MEALSKDELKTMDDLRDEIEKKEHDQDLENAKAMLADKWDEVVKVIYPLEPCQQLLHIFVLFKVEMSTKASIFSFVKSNSRSTEMTEVDK